VLVSMITLLVHAKAQRHVGRLDVEVYEKDEDANIQPTFFMRHGCGTTLSSARRETSNPLCAAANLRLMGEETD